MRARLMAALALAFALVTCARPAPAPEPERAAPVRAGSGGVNAPEHRDNPYLVLVGLDGFRWDYLDRFDPPSLRRVARAGVRAEGLIPVFPSKTFPNFYSIATGVYAERHGIVANAFYDPARGETFAIGDRDAVGDGTWYRGEPIWVTAERQGMVAACFFWPGSEAAIDGVRPTVWRTYDAAITNDQRVDTVLEWLRRPAETRPHVVTLYFSDVDSTSHGAPTGGEETREAVLRVDRALGRLLDGLETSPVRGRVYLVLVSDHGMTDTGPARTRLLSAFVETSGLLVPEAGPVVNIHVTGGANAARVLRDRLNERLEHGRAYLRSDVPARLHYRADPRIGDVVVVMDEGYMLVVPREGRRLPAETYGMHGWDPALRSMHGIFLASGPGLPSGITIPRFENVDIYPWLVNLLGLRAGAVDGDAGRLPQLIRGASRAPATVR